MAIAAYFHPEKLTTAQYDDVVKKLEAAGHGSPAGRLHHSAFNDGEGLSVFEIWESQAAFEAFGPKLMPILEEAGIQAEPMVMPVHNMVQ